MNSQDCTTCHHTIVDHLLGAFVEGLGCKRVDCDCTDYARAIA